MGRLMALDYGEARIGVAFSDETETIAFAPEPPLKNSAGVLEKLKQLKKKYEVKKIVLGLPKGLSGGTGTKEAEVVKFAKKLETALGIGCDFIDERFSTARAGNLLSGHGIKVRRRKEYVDNASAVVILEDYLIGRKK